MGSYTPNLKLYMAGDNDFVDVTADVANNMAIIDEAVYEATTLEVNNNSFAAQATPTYRNKHVFSTWNGGIRTWDNKATDFATKAPPIANWHTTHAEPTEWTSLTSLLTGWTEVPGFKAYYRFLKEDMAPASPSTSYSHIELRGRLMLGTNYSPIVENTVYQFANYLPSPMYVPQIPTAQFGNWQRVTMGNSPSSSTVYNAGYVSMFPGLSNGDGTISFGLSFYRKVGTNGTAAQTAANTENYFCLDGVRLLVANGPNI